MAASSESWRDGAFAVALAGLAAVAIKLPELFGVGLDGHEGFYARNLSLFVLPILAGWLAWRRKLSTASCAGLAAAFAAAAVFANLPDFAPGGALEVLVAVHLPIALWLAVGIAHAGGHWRDPAARMRFVRFSGELFLHYVLIALGGVVFMAFTFALFASIGRDIEPVFERWLLPCGAMGAVMIAAWLVERRPNALATVTTLLTRVFTPMFTLLLLVFLATLTWSGRGPDFQRDVLIAYDLLLVLVVGLVLFALAGREPGKPAGAFDALQLVLVIAALLVDLAALWAIGARIADAGLTPNRAAALAENLILLVNLAGSALLYAKAFARRATLEAIERWQLRFLPVYSLWAAVVVVLFPFVFND